MKTLEKYLPIGSVVLTKNATKKIMITGFCGMDYDDKNATFDYCGCLYPEGILQASDTFLFNHNQIEEIIFLGYDNEEEKEFKSKLKKMLSNNSEMENK